MTTAEDRTTDPAPDRPVAGAATRDMDRTTIRDDVAAEWLKTRTMPSTWYVAFAIGVTVLLSGLIAWQVSAAWDAADEAARAQIGASPVENGLTMLVQMFVASFAALVVTTEYASGSISTTLWATPRRVRVLGAKTIVVGVAGLVAGLIAAFAMYGLITTVLGDRAVPAYADSMVQELPRLAALGVSVCVIGLVALGLGFVTRSTTGALTSIALLLFVLPNIARFLPEPWEARFVAVTMHELPPALAGEPDTYLSPWGAALVLSVYVVLALGSAWSAFRSRDA